MSFSWTDPQPLTAEAKTLRIYHEELVDAVKDLEDEIGITHYTFTLAYPLPEDNPPYAPRYKVIHVISLRNAIDRLIDAYGYVSESNPLLLGRPWTPSDFVTDSNRALRRRWDYQILQDFRDVLDKLVGIVWKETWANRDGEVLRDLGETPLEYILEFPDDDYVPGGGQYNNTIPIERIGADYIWYKGLGQGFYDWRWAGGRKSGIGGYLLKGGTQMFGGSIAGDSSRVATIFAGNGKFGGTSKTEAHIITEVSQSGANSGGGIVNLFGLFYPHTFEDSAKITFQNLEMSTESSTSGDGPHSWALAWNHAAIFIPFTYTKVGGELKKRLIVYWVGNKEPDIYPNDENVSVTHLGTEYSGTLVVDLFAEALSRFGDTIRLAGAQYVRLQWYGTTFGGKGFDPIPPHLPVLDQDAFQSVSLSVGTIIYSH